MGESVSVCGACLSVVAVENDRFSAEMMPETIVTTTLGAKALGARVNLERAVKVGDRLGGHWVLGHVDGKGRLERIEGSGLTRKIWISFPKELAYGIAPKGSITLDGVSLTVISVRGPLFSVGIIPTTLSETTLRDLKVGEELNLETDVLAKYVRSVLTAESALSKPSSLNWDKLDGYGGYS